MSSRRRKKGGRNSAIVGEWGNTLRNLYVDVARLVGPRIKFEHVFFSLDQRFAGLKQLHIRQGGPTVRDVKMAGRTLDSPGTGRGATQRPRPGVRSLGEIAIGRHILPRIDDIDVDVFLVRKRTF